MKLKQLESFLGDLEQFSNPKVELEQYPTGPHIASRMLYTAENSFGDVSNKVVADFGCGCGTLGAAAALLGAEQVIGIDVDAESLEIASMNAEELETPLKKGEANTLFKEYKRWMEHFKRSGSERKIKIQVQWAADGLSHGQIVDTVVMNPPFGTRKKGADMDFLSVALQVASHAVYSLHKTSTRDHVKRAALRDFGAISAEVLSELRFDVRQLYKFHKKKEVDVAVDLWRFVPNNSQGRRS